MSDTKDSNYDSYTSWKDWSGDAGRSARFSARFKLANRHIAARLRDAGVRRVCEIGVGSGRLANYLASLDIGVTAIDLNPPPAIDPRVNFLQGDANVLLNQLRADPFDAVLAIDMLEHVEPAQLGALLAAAHACLKPGGMLMIQVPNAASPLGVSFQEGDFTHRSRFSAASLRQVLMTQGFDVTACAGAPLPLLPVTSLLSRPAYWLGAGLWKLVQSAAGIRGEVFRPNLFAVARKI